MDHDRLFKQLLQTFFAEFLDLFLPAVAGYVESGSLTFLDKELFTDLSAGERHEVDLLAKCRFSGRDSFFLVHVETQASARAGFAERMFGYFARLTERHRLPVYPVALLTFEDPRRPEPDRYDVAFPDLEVLAFRFRAIQLNQMDWRAFVRRPNPVAAALMTRMRIDPLDRPRVKLEILRLLVTLKLDPARQELVRGFMDAYLALSEAEMAVYDREVAAIDPPEREAVMQVVNEWEARGEARGLAKGKVEGKAELIVHLLRRRLGPLPAPLTERVEALPPPKLESLGDAMFDFRGVADVEAWLTRHAAD